jgi:hypothetical protein
MLHHVSFNARNPENVAHVVAAMSGARAVRSPSPPFPGGSWFVCFGDSGGSFLEIIPWGHVLDPAAPAGIGRDDHMRERSGSHVLVSTPHSIAAIEAAADREGWRVEMIDARLFKVVKVWIENAVLIEFLTPEIARAYLTTFGTSGIATLDATLRTLEAPRAG